MQILKYDLIIYFAVTYYHYTIYLTRFWKYILWLVALFLVYFFLHYSYVFWSYLIVLNKNKSDTTRLNTIWEHLSVQIKILNIIWTKKNILFEKGNVIVDNAFNYSKPRFSLLK